MSLKRLQDKKAIVTGGTRGIGRSIAELFAKEGASVVVVGTNADKGQEVVTHLSQNKLDDKQNFFFRKVDVSSHEEVSLFSNEIAGIWEGVDILVNCAGITRDRLMIRMKEEDWDLVIDTNLKSVYNMTYTFLRNMLKRRCGKIINVASVVGLIGNPGQANYAASKAGMIGMTKTLAKEAASRDVRINCIAPGFIETDMTAAFNDQQKDQIIKQIPMGRMGLGNEIAHAALFLASDESKYITGQVLTVDGGLTA